MRAVTLQWSGGTGSYPVSANMPAILIEIGYLTNPDQERQLASAEFQNPFVQGVLDAIVRFRDMLDEKHRPAASGAGK